MNFKLSLPAFFYRLPSKPYLKFFILGILFYLFFLVTTVPAEWLAWGINKYSHGSATLTQTSGTAWKGQGLLSVSYNRGKPVNLGHINWNIHAIWLLIGQLDTTLDLSGKSLQLNTQATAGMGGFTIKNLRASILADNLGSIYGPASLFSPLGQISINSQKLSISNKGILGSGEAKWVNAGSALSTVKPLGDYILKLKGTGENASLVLETDKNSALKVTGKGNWTLINGLINFTGTATPVTNKSELNSLLALLGRDIGAGKRSLRFNTRIPFSYKTKKSK